MRRKLFGGYDPGQVDAEIERRESELAELRRDVASLWLAYTRNESQIRQLGDRIEALESEPTQAAPATSAPPPLPPAAVSTPAPDPVSSDRANPPPLPPPVPRAEHQVVADNTAVDVAEDETLRRRTEIRDQLSELDQVLAAIEEATATLETTYAAEIEGQADEEPRPRS